MCITVAACGAERSSDDVEAAPSSTTEETADGETGEGGEDAGEGDEDTSEDPADAAPTTTVGAPATTGAPEDVALSADFDGTSWEITHGELNEVVVPTQDNEEFVTLVFGGQSPPGFDVGVLTEHLVREAVQLELDELGVEVSDENRDTARDRLVSQVETLFPSEEDPNVEAQRLYDEVPYLSFLTEYQAAQDALTEELSEEADPADGVPCVRHILLEAEADADAAVERLDDGEDFAELATELSTGPSGPNGGDLGCAPTSNYVPEFAAAVDSAEVGAVVGPVETEFGWHVILVERFEVDGQTIAAERIRERLTGVDVEVDEAIGQWDTEQLAVVPPGL